MAQTHLMRADEIVAAFNGTAERKYFKATIGGTQRNPEVHYVSRSTMVRVTYRIVQDEYVVTFSKTAAAFGDYTASVFKALAQIHTSLKAAGVDIAQPLHPDATLRMEYDPQSKTTTVHLSKMGDPWLTVEPAPFKVPERYPQNIPPEVRKNTLEGLDGAL